MNRGPAISSNRDPLDPSPTPPPCRRFTAFFLVSSSFLIAANRDVKTIRALLADSDPMLSSFSSLIATRFISFSLSFPPLVYSYVCVCLSLKTPPSTLDYSILFAIEQRPFEETLDSVLYIRVGNEGKFPFGLDTCFDFVRSSERKKEQDSADCTMRIVVLLLFEDS